MSDNARDYSSVQLTPRELRYLKQLTRQANPADGLRVFCSYVGWYNTDTNKPRCKPFADQLERLRQLAALPNLCNKLK